MDEVKIPQPKIVARTPNQEVEAEALRAGLHPLLARVLASRSLPAGMTASEMLALKLSHLEHPHNMKDMQKAAARLAKAIVDREVIALETDHDCDGQTSHAVLYYNLSHHFKHPKELIQSYIGHRLTEGYGLSDSVANRILANEVRPKLVITADNGSSDEPRIKKLKAAGIEAIVTDHHAVPVDAGPVSAFAFINPTQEACSYEDKCIAGCMVAWLLMSATRTELIKLNYLPQDAPKLTDSLDYVAVGTVADCVSIARSKNNRPVVTYGLQLIERGTRPCWRALHPLLNEKITAEDLGFKIGPLLNSDGRLACAFGSVNFLLAETDAEAIAQVNELQEQNKRRKEIQKKITIQGVSAAAKQLNLVNDQNFSICMYLADGHVGVHGISASRIKDAFGRPTAIFAPKLGSEGVISGSIRTIEGFHVRNGLQFVADAAPGLLLAFGGHQGAGGVTILEKDFELFAELFEQAASAQLAVEDLGPVILTDGKLGKDWISLAILETLSALEPFGREFEAPVFQNEAEVVALKAIGDGTHFRVTLNIEGKLHQGVWFNARQSSNSPLPVKVADEVVVAFALKLNNFRGARNCELQIYAMQRI